jgi:hypothetical protein
VHVQNKIKAGLMSLKKEKKNYAGSKTLPASIKKKETHWPKVPLSLPHLA